MIALVQIYRKILKREGIIICIGSLSPNGFPDLYHETLSLCGDGIRYNSPIGYLMVWRRHNLRL